MKEIFLIKQIMSKVNPSSNQGYWDGDGRFRGIVFAQQYSTYQEASDVIKTLPKGYYNIEKLFEV